MRQMREVVGPEPSEARLLALLKQTNDDVDRAVRLFFEQPEAAPAAPPKRKADASAQQAGLQRATSDPTRAAPPDDSSRLPRAPSAFSILMRDVQKRSRVAAPSPPVPIDEPAQARGSGASSVPAVAPSSAAGPWKMKLLRKAEAIGCVVSQLGSAAANRAYRRGRLSTVRGTGIVQVGDRLAFEACGVGMGTRGRKDPIFLRFSPSSRERVSASRVRACLRPPSPLSAADRPRCLWGGLPQRWRKSWRRL